MHSPWWKHFQNTGMALCPVDQPKGLLAFFCCLWLWYPWFQRIDTTSLHSFCSSSALSLKLPTNHRHRCSLSHLRPPHTDWIRKYGHSPSSQPPPTPTHQPTCAHPWTQLDDMPFPFSNIPAFSTSTTVSWSSNSLSYLSSLGQARIRIYRFLQHKNIATPIH